MSKLTIPPMWRDFDGVNRRMDEMEPGHLLNAADHVEERIVRLRRAQDQLRQCARAATCWFGYGEGVALEMRRNAFKRGYARHMKSMEISRALRRAQIQIPW